MPDADRKRRFRLARRLAALGCLAGLLVAAWFGFWRFHLKRFEVVAPGVLYRSAQPSQYGIEHLIEWHGVNTVLCLRRDDDPLTAGLFDAGEADGPLESELVREMGATYLHWPMGGEAYWPWLGPDEFESFFELFDDPRRLPVAIHCVGGRHRTGTIAALYRLEYDRWPIERTLEEMYAFDFGDPVPIQEHNLRTYWPRPRPSDGEWQALRAFFGKAVDPEHFDDFVRSLRQKLQEHDEGIEDSSMQFVRTRQPFSLELALRLIDDPQNPLAVAACVAAAETLASEDSSAQQWSAAAALVADYGTADQQAKLLAILTEEPRTGTPSPRYAAVVVGVTNRFTENRIPFLRPLLDDLRFRPEPQAVHRREGRITPYRYCDTAVAVLASITNENNIYAPSLWEPGRQFALQWFAEHPDAQQLTTLRKSRSFFLAMPAAEDRDDYRR